MKIYTALVYNSAIDEFFVENFESKKMAQDFLTRDWVETIRPLGEEVTVDSYNRFISNLQAHNNVEVLKEDGTTYYLIKETELHKKGEKNE